ncbi:MAG: alpha/beta fold hydrolase [Pseudomonadota bacterium]
MTPLVLVHGFLGGARQWQEQVAGLSAGLSPGLSPGLRTGLSTGLSTGRRVLPLDLPGFGARVGEAAPTTIDGFAEAVIADMDAAGIERCHLLGHSMGGMVVQAVLARAPERIERLVLYATAPSGALPDRFESFETSKQRAAADGAKATARRIAATWFAEGAASPGYPACAAIAEQAGLAAIHAGLDAMAAWRGIGGLERVACPTLVLWGDRDRTYAWRDIEALWRGIPGAALAVVPGCGHAVHLETPVIFNAIVARFLDG